MIQVPRLVLSTEPGCNGHLIVPISPGKQATGLFTRVKNEKLLKERINARKAIASRFFSPMPARPIFSLTRILLTQQVSGKHEFDHRYNYEERMVNEEEAVQVYTLTLWHKVLARKHCSLIIVDP